MVETLHQHGWGGPGDFHTHGSAVSRQGEMLAGGVELVAGLLLFLPRTATLGALLSLAATGYLFAINMTYDVPVKILSFHLLLMSVYLLAPQARRLANVLVLERPAEPASQPPLFSGRRADRIATAAQVAPGIWVLLSEVLAGWQLWNTYGGGRTKPELYGIWSVTEFTRDNVPPSPLTTDEDRWQRLVFDVPDIATIQFMDGSLVYVPAKTDTAAHAVTLYRQQPRDVVLAKFQDDRNPAGRLRLDGQVNGHPVTITLEPVDLDSFTLRNRGFHWVQ